MFLKSALPLGLLLSMSTAMLETETAYAQSDCSPSRVMFLLDKSSSMNNPAGDEEGAPTKWEVATDALDAWTQTYADGMQLGLTVFPTAGECSVGESAVAPKFAARADILAALSEPPPEAGNWTPMAQALAAAGQDPSFSGEAGANYVVLITDGWQVCYPYENSSAFTPVDEVRTLTDSGVTVFVVGFGEGVHREMLSQSAVAAGTARAGCDQSGDDPDSPCYYQADTPSELNDALMAIAAQIPEGEVCDGEDNDCDGQIDEDATVECQGACGAGVRTCENGIYGSCSSAGDEFETCNGFDDDCDGQVDEADAAGPALCEDGSTCEAGVCGGGEASGCGCEASPGAGSSLFFAGMLFAVFGFVLRRRRA